jgi:hypothetical protein
MLKTYEGFKKSEEIIELRFSLFDWDDNLLYMPTIVHLDKYENGKWTPIDISTSDFHYYITSKKTRMRNNSFHETFKEQTDDGPRGNKAFVLDTIKAVKNKQFGPSWYDFIHSLVDGRIFLIITARGHEPLTIRKAVEWIIENYLTEEQKEEMKKNLFKYCKLFGNDAENIIEHYLDRCDYVAIMSNYFKETFDVPDMKISQLVGYGKYLVIKRFLNKVRKSSKLLGMPAKVGFSDDRKRTVDDVIEFLSGEKSIDEPIEYYVFDTSRKNKIRIKL